jgi:hypothetical protein
MVVTGWVRANGRPLGGTEFIVNRVSREEKRAVVPVWHDRTDSNGRFEFSCYKESREDKVYYQVNFSLPDTMIGKYVGLLKVTNVMPVFSGPGEYALDTLNIEFTKRGHPSYRRGLTVQASSELDSLLLSLPDLEMVFQVKLVSAVLGSGELKDIQLEYVLPEMDSSTQFLFVEQMKASRLFLKESDGEAAIITY